MSKVVILGSGAAPGVPAIAKGFGRCNPNNPKNVRLRSGTYMELNGVKFLVDTSPDLRTQLLLNKIYSLDAVFYTHTHADHLHGIDDLREINRISGGAIDLFASTNNLQVIRQRFPYLIADSDESVNPIFRAALRPHDFIYEKSFMFNGLKVTPILLEGHNVEVTGYIFNDGEVVHIADCRLIPEQAFKYITKKPQVVIMPLTTPNGTRYHASFDDLFNYAQRLQPAHFIINHMAVECDYDDIKSRCTDFMEPAYDGLTISWD